MLASAALIALGCSKKAESETPTKTTETTETSHQGDAGAPATTEAATAGKSYPTRGGPVLAAVAGKGVGPIMLGANTGTIERLMTESCNEKTESLCKFYYRALEFELEDGVAARIRVHRVDRRAGTSPDGKPILYGVFNGAIPPDGQFGMFRAAVEESIGRPTSERAATDAEKATGNGTVEVTEYDGMTLEYDRLENGNVVLGGIIIEKPASKKPASTRKAQTGE